MDKEKIKFLLEGKDGETFYEYQNRVKSNNFIHEIKGNTTNNGKLILLNEVKIDRLLGLHSENGYIIISASRSLPQEDVNGNEINYSQDELNRQNNVNNQNYQKLLSQIKSSGYSFTPVYGGFIENKGTPDEKQVYEKSFIVLNMDRESNPKDFSQLHKLGIEWCNEYNQDSVLIKAPNEPPKYYAKDNSVDMEFTGDIKINDISQQYFTDLHKSKQVGKISKQGDLYNKKHRITFEGVYVNPYPTTNSEGHVRYMMNEIFFKSKNELK